MNGSSILNPWSGPVVPTNWVIVGNGDFYGTGHNNCILWRDSTTGQLAEWEMNGGTITNSGFF